MNPKKPSAAPLLAEIAFRKFHKNMIGQVLEYMELAYRERLPIFKQLQNEGHTLSPFIEIGAETGANSLALVNGLGTKGAACDISPDSLLAMTKYAQILNAEKLPLRIVLDSRRLPFLNHSLPFVLAWGTIHHFDEPRQALEEIRRVLHPAGCFYFDGEPVKRRMSLNMWTTRAYPNMPPFEAWLLEKGLLSWIATIDGAESIASGVIERKPSLTEWRTLLDPVFNVNWRYYPYITAMVPSAGRLARKGIAKLFPGQEDEKTVDFFGGSIGGICNVKSSAKSVNRPVERISDAFACPDCLTITDRCAPDVCSGECLTVCSEKAILQKSPYIIDQKRCSWCQNCLDACTLSAIDRVQLAQTNQKDHFCPMCKTTFPKKGGLLYLLARDTRKKLSDVLC